MPMRTRLALSVACFVLVVGTLCGAVHAQNKGFQINRYEPTPAGEWSFMVDHPWYSSTRWFAAGITLNYGHDPLVYGQFDGSSFTKLRPLIEHQLLGHVDLAGSFLDRITLHVSLPITLYEGGEAAGGVTPLGGAGVGDLRIGVMARLWKHADVDPISVHLGIAFWAPFGLDNHQGDAGLRVMPKVVLAGYAHHVRWSADLAFYYRPKSTIGTEPSSRGNTIGSEVQLGALVAYADKVRRFSVGPELLLSTVVLGGSAFGRDYTSLELLLGAHYHVAKQVMAGLAVGMGILREPGTPDARVLLRLAYAPERTSKPKDKDTDGDGIVDRLDRCPNDPEDKDGFEDDDGCPDPDNDKDGILDASDKCPNEPEDKDGFEDDDDCSDPDNDKDGILDASDKCPNEPEDKDGFEDDDGCPDPDNDKDGILDAADKCPNEPEDKDSFEDEDGCPDPDNDKDGILDASDKCPNEPGPAANLGCPDKDKDGDGVVDRLDNCPDEPGDPANQGCKKKQLAQLRNGRIDIIDSVYFETDKDKILPRSFPLLTNVAEVVAAHPDIKRIRVEGHTDNRGKPAHNMDLSERRARSVVAFLVAHGLEAARLEARGYGPTQPIADNKTADGRSRNRRVVFTILDGADGSKIENREQGPSGETK